MEPKVIVLDEPTSQLDPIGTREVFEVVKEMSRRGMTVLMAEHKLEWVAEFSDRVIALADGTLFDEGPPNTVLTSPRITEIGGAVTRYTSVARAAREQQLWPENRNLPVTLDQAAQGFQGGIDD